MNARWSCTADVVVVGSGAAGLTCARELVSRGKRVLVITKSDLDAGNTRWAQGGIADPGTDLAGHIADTVTAGAGLADPFAVADILGSGRAAIDRLIAAGATFDGGDGWDSFTRTREGGHRRDRIVHAGGDATGAEVERVLAAPGGLPAVLTGHLAVDLLLDRDGRAGGLTVLDSQGIPGLVHAAAVVLATGGSGAMFAASTNPAQATGDGLAIALRAGALLADLEFVQFHPTALHLPGATGRRPLVTEALRGAGARLLDGAGRSVTAGVHPMGDLAPRDVVSLAISRRLADNPGGIGDHVFLDASAVEDFGRRFPTVAASLRANRFRPDAIPVSPAAHYQCGGVLAGVDGRTSVPGLYAIGEVARTGLHGANRLASNSLLEALVTGERAAAAIATDRGRPNGDLVAPVATAVDPNRLDRVRAAMSRHAGIGRRATGLETAAGVLRTALGAAPERAGDRSVQAGHLVTAASAVLAAALERSESRGCHVRLDHPEPGVPGTVLVRLADGSVQAQLVSPIGSAELLKPMEVSR